MLDELTVHNFALIEKANIKFGRGLNILSGETGAGKSILLGAIGLLLGQKTDTAVIRTGASEALVSGVVKLNGTEELGAWLKQRGIEAEDERIIIRRSVNRNGRGAVFLNSIPVTRKDLAELAALLFDVHGQHEHQSLLKAENHRKLLDRFGQSEELCAEVSQCYSDLASLKERYSKLIASERERLREIDILKYAVAEISAAKLQPGEEEELEKEQSILSNHERLFLLVEQVNQALAESQGGALVNLRNSRVWMEELIQIDAELANLNNQLQDAFYEIEDFAQSMSSYHSSMTFDPDRLEKVQERLAKIAELEKKYGDTIPEVLKYGAMAEENLAGLENYADEKAKLERDIKLREESLLMSCQKLTEKRKAAAVKLEKQIESELQKLGMPKVRFKVLLTRKENEKGAAVISAYGADNIEFVIASNPGEPFKRLAKIASGGELSRVMLAIKSILAESDHIDILVFDEVDAGIGGEVAVQVGEHLKKLSRLKQVLCITHLATIAVRADNHFMVSKKQKDDRTITVIEKINKARITEELSRMLSGDAAGEAAQRHALELQKRYNE